MKNVLRSVLLSLCVVSAIAQSPYSNTIFLPVTMTASAQTSAAIQLGTKQGNTWKSGSYSGAAITLTGNSLTTATFGVLGSADGGVTYYPIPINAILTPTTTSATVTATAAGLYQVNLAGLTHVKFVTSGTFTATSITLTLTASPNAASSNGGGSGSGLTSLPGVQSANLAGTTRSDNTTYQNTSGKIVTVEVVYNIGATGTLACYSDSNSTPSIIVAGSTVFGTAGNKSASFQVPNSYYYKCHDDQSPTTTLASWVEVTPY